jgi:nucleoside-diphosphate-sugar epimerase
MSFWSGKKVLVTGGAGFIGSHLVEALVRGRARVRVVDNLENGSLGNLESCRAEVDFLQEDLTQPESCKRAVKGMEMVFNLAARVGGIEYNVKHPGSMFTANVYTPDTALYRHQKGKA